LQVDTCYDFAIFLVRFGGFFHKSVYRCTRFQAQVVQIDVENIAIFAHRVGNKRELVHLINNVVVHLFVALGCLDFILIDEFQKVIDGYLGHT
jgi:hypothetical protein